MDARDKFLSLEREKEWQLPVHESSNRGHEISRRANESGSRGGNHPQDAIGRSPSWEFGGRGLSSRYYYQESRRSRDYRDSKESKDFRDRESRNHKRDSYSSREDLIWPKSDRDTGYGSRDGLLREKRGTREWDKGYGTYDTRDSEMWRRESGHRTPDIWEQRTPERSLSPSRARNRSPARELRVPKIKMTDRQEYQRAKSMHDLSHRRIVQDDDPRRRSMYDPMEEQSSLQNNRKHIPHFHSHANLPRPTSSCSSKTDSTATSGGIPPRGYNELPDNQRYPGLDRATARPDPLEHSIMRSATAPGISKKTYDYPVNGGCAPIQLTRTYHDDYRRFRYDHSTPQFIRSTSVPAAQY